MAVNIELFDTIYDFLELNKEAIRYSPALTKDSKTIDGKFPRVLMVEVDNINTDLTTNSEEFQSDIYLTFFIYAEDVVTEEGLVPRVDVARGIWKDIDFLLRKGIRKIRSVGTARPIQNLNNSVYELAINYAISLNNRNLFI